MRANPDFVEAVLAKDISVSCSTASLIASLKALGAMPSDATSNRWLIGFSSQAGLANALASLQRLGLPFLDTPTGWPPAAVFDQLKDQGALDGNISRIFWHSPSNYSIT